MFYMEVRRPAIRNALPFWASIVATADEICAQNVMGLVAGGVVADQAVGLGGGFFERGGYVGPAEDR